MMIEFYKVQKENIKELTELANFIWREYWGIILKSSQIDYMLENFQSEKAIINQIDNENYEYYFLFIDGITAGYFGISLRKKYLFLSKLYIKKEYINQGIGRNAFIKIIEIAKENGYKNIQLTVNKYNDNTIKAYKKWGFKIINSVVTDIGNGFVMDDFIMEYCL